MPMAIAMAMAKPATTSCWLRSSSCHRGRWRRSSVGRLRKVIWVGFAPRAGQAGSLEGGRHATRWRVEPPRGDPGPGRRGASVRPARARAPGADRLPAQGEHADERLAHDPAGHLGASRLALAEDDRDLDDPRPPAMSPPRHLDLE